MRYIASMAIALALAMPMAGSANAGWTSFSERFSDKNIGKALGDKNCWARAFSFQKVKRTTCRR